MTTKLDKRVGLKPKDRQLATHTDKQLTANQWRNTPQQNEFMAYYLDVDSPTFGNAYQSALRAKYSTNYALQVASVGNQWITDYHKLASLRLEHLELKLIQMINGRPDSKSPDDTKVKAIETLARLKGMIDNKGSVTNNILVQPILNGSSVNGTSTQTRVDTPQASVQTSDVTSTRDTHIVEADLIPD